MKKSPYKGPNVNVILIHQAFVSPDEAGGTRHYELGRQLTRYGHHFVIVASGTSYLSGKQFENHNKLVSEQNMDGVHVMRVSTPSCLHSGKLGRIIALLCFMASSIYGGLRAGRVDLVMGTSPPIFQAVSAWALAYIRRVPFLLEIRDLWPAFLIDMRLLKNPVLIGVFRWIERFLYSRANHIIVNSPAYRDYLLEKGIPNDKISFIPNGVDPSMFDSAADGAEIRREFDLDERFVVCYAGALGLANDIPTLLRAARRLKHRRDIHFLLVGDGIDRCNLQTKAKEFGLVNVTFAGARPKTQMSKFLAAADVCVAILKNIPMFRTTYPNKVFDYMASGRPTILAIDGVIRDVIETAQGGIFVEPGDDAALAAAVCRLADNREEAHTVGAAARRYVIENFNRQDQAVAFRDLIVRLSL